MTKSAKNRIVTICLLLSVLYFSGTFRMFSAVVSGNCDFSSTEVLLNRNSIVQPVNEHTISIDPATGCTFSQGNQIKIADGENAIFRIELPMGYSKTDDFTVRTENYGNDSVLMPDAHGDYILSGVKNDITVSVSGIDDMTSPEITAQSGPSKVLKFLNGFTYGLVPLGKTSVSLSAADSGSGVDSLCYCILPESKSLSEIKSISESDWTACNAKSLNKKISSDETMYVKSTDKRGNTAYYCSESGTPEVSGIETGERYYETVGFSVRNLGLGSVRIDGKEAFPDADRVYRINPDNKRHYVEISGGDGSRQLFTLSVFEMYKVKFVADGKVILEKSVKYHDSLSQDEIPEVPYKEGCEQVIPHWDRDDFTYISSDITANAVYTADKCTVTFVADGVKLGEKSVDYAGMLAQADIPQIPEKQGYTATPPRWEVSDFSRITHDMEVDAVYTPDPRIPGESENRSDSGQGFSEAVTVNTEYAANAAHDDAVSQTESDDESSAGEAAAPEARLPVPAADTPKADEPQTVSRTIIKGDFSDMLAWLSIILIIGLLTVSAFKKILKHNKK